MQFDPMMLARARLAMRVGIRNHLFDPNVRMVSVGLPEKGGKIIENQLAIRYHVVEKYHSQIQLEAALENAVEAANGADVRIGGGASTIQQYLRAGLVDEMHIVIVPILLGDGERLFDNLGRVMVGYECVELVASTGVVHVRIVRSSTGGG